MSTTAILHAIDVSTDDAPVTIPLQRTPDMDWPGCEPVVHVPVTLLLAARGRCCCPTCINGFVRLVARSQLRVV